MKEAVQRPQPLGMTPSFGFGDRLGLATPGHVEAMKQAGVGIAPIFAQQSIREMTRTVRTPDEVMGDALEGMAVAGWTGTNGADADHLKTPADVDTTLAAGFCFFTIDPSDHVDKKTDNYDESTLRDRFDSVRGEIEWADAYRGKQVSLPTGTTVNIDREAVMRAAVKYGRALNEGIALADYIARVNEAAGTGYEIELSVDETDQPTTLAEHFIIADQCLQRGMKLVSLAPRFIGDMEKGVDYIGDVEAVEKSITDHHAIAEILGPYKLSLHSGSEKVSMYTAFARATKGQFHVKTAGTSYLEALRVVVRHDPALFRSIVDFARERYETDRATYHVHATVEGVPAPDDISSDEELERLYLERWEDVPEGQGFTEAGRQILHCTFGSVLTHDTFGPVLRACLLSYPDTYIEILALHFGKHLQALRAGM